MTLRHTLTVLILLLCAGLAQAQGGSFRWHAGHAIADSTVRRLGTDYCFAAIPIDDATFSRMQGRSYKAGARIQRSELRYLRLLHVTLDGRTLMGEMVCNRALAADLVEIFHELYRQHYPIERMVLIDEYDADDERSMAANNTSCFNYRLVSGTTSLSAHARGCAVDLNPFYNPYVHTRNGRQLIEPRGSERYANRAASFSYKIDRTDLAYRLFTAHGFTWGGAWRTMKDYQHFEKR